MYILDLETKSHKIMNHDLPKIEFESYKKISLIYIIHKQEMNQSHDPNNININIRITHAFYFSINS